MLAASVSVISYKLCSVDLEDLVFLVSSIFSCSYIHSASSSMGIPDLPRERFDGDSLLRTVCSKIILSVYCLAAGLLVPSTVEISLSDDG